MEDRVRTGIEGFDLICGGGLIRGNTYLLSGPPGSGKTIWGLQYIYRGALDQGEPGIYLTTEERPSRLRSYAARFGWNLEDLENKGSIAIIDATSARIGLPASEKYVEIRELNFEHVLDQLLSLRDELGARRVVVDSASSISYTIGDPLKVRPALLKLCILLQSLGFTSLLVYEMPDVGRSYGFEPFLADGEIILYYKRLENERIRGVEMYKMRGSAHSNKIHPMEITPHGIVVHPDQQVYGVF